MRFSKKVNIFLLVASLLMAVALVWPIFKSSLSGVFYEIDPDVIYVGNALSYIKNHLIHYRDHPGTPTIVLIASSFWPLRIYAKIVEATPFITWSFENIRFLFLYARVFMILIFVLSAYLFTCAVFKSSGSFASSIFAFLALLVFSFFPRLSGAILAESGSFLFISLWLFIFSYFLREESPFLVIILGLIAGLAIAVKYNNFALALTVPTLILYAKEFDFKQKIYNMVAGAFIVVSGFVLGTWAIRGSYRFILGSITKIFLSSGQGGAHGYGQQGFLNLEAFKTSLAQFINAERQGFVVIILAVLLVLYVLIKRKIKISSPITLLFASTFLSFLFILKYPATYYQLPNYVLFVFVVSTLLSKLPKLIPLLLIVIFIPMAVSAFQNYRAFLAGMITDSVILESHIKNNPSQKATLWDFGPTQDFVYIWIRDWGAGIFDQELREKRPDLLELKADYKTVHTDYVSKADVFDVCWDKLYIREERGKEFLNIYKDKSLTFEPIGKTGIGVIESGHCTTKL